MSKGETTSITVKKKSPFKQLALTISANDNGRGKGVREIAQGYRPRAPVQRAFNAVPHWMRQPFGSTPISSWILKGQANDN